MELLPLLGTPVGVRPMKRVPSSLSIDRAGFGITRRCALMGAGSLPLLLLGKPGWAQAGPLPVIDAHVHLFNAADLPITGFAKYTLIDEWIGESRKKEALIDFLGGYVRDRALSLESELGSLGADLESEIDPESFGAEASDYIERRKRDALSNNAPALAASYRELEASLAADANYPAATIEKMIAPNAFSARDRRAILSHALTRAARTSEEPERSAWELGDFVAYRARAGDPSMAAVGITAGIGEVIRAFGWGYQMLKGRRKHLRKYLDSYSSDAAAPRVIVNHLVDYDYWLGDRPRSDHIAQVRFYDRLARLALPTKLLTFAGFCPLRLAIERATPGVTPLFDQLKGLHAQGMIAGFKLYPPMGFKPIGNDELHNAEFDPPPPQRMTALDARYSVSAGALGPQLDTALRDLYKFAQDNSVPIMAHARQSNGAGPQYEGRADPRAWEEVANSYKLNIMLGHLIDGPDAFVGSAAGAPKDRSWPLDASIRLLKSNFPTGSEVLGDLGYMPEIIDNRALARDFFKRLKQDFGPDGVRRVCFGTDWIMLGRERDYEEYLEAVRIGMKDANYTDVEQAGILYANAMRYLRVSSV